MYYLVLIWPVLSQGPCALVFLMYKTVGICAASLSVSILTTCKATPFAYCFCHEPIRDNIRTDT